MSDFTSTPFIPHFGEDCPDPALLQTGDLLLPRLPTGFHAAVEDAEDSALRSHVRKLRNFSQVLQREVHLWDMGHPADDLTLRRLFKDKSPLLVPPSNVLKLSSERTNMVGGLLGRPQYLALTEELQINARVDDLRTKLLLLKVLESEFSDLIDQWLDMTLKQFMAHSIGRFLMKTLQSSEVTSSFFVGHVAMVVRESNGEVVKQGGDLLVIEDNTTDFSHYRTAVHPYYVPTDVHAQHQDGQFLKNREDANWFSHSMRGWVNRRRALGEHIWAVRPKVLRDETALNPQEILKVMQRMADEAKRLHGRPYGFFDHYKLGNDDRMYCAEFIQVVFQQTAHALQTIVADKLDIKEHRTWAWMQKYLNRPAPYGDPELLSLINDVLKDKPAFLPSRPFFLITPAMLAEASSMDKLFTPTSGIKDQYAQP